MEQLQMSGTQTESSAQQEWAALPSSQPGPGSPLAGWYGEYDEAGVDLSLLRWMLQLTPYERLVHMERHARDTLLLYEYGLRHREAEARGDL